jgi:hypothetical protein
MSSGTLARPVRAELPPAARRSAPAVSSKTAARRAQDAPGAHSGPAEVDETDEIANAWLRERPGTPVSSIGVVTRMWHAAKLFGDDRRRTLAQVGGA